MERTNRASIEFSLLWESEYARHTDRFFSGKVDFWRDVFPGKMEGAVLALHQGEVCRETFEAGVLVPPFQERNIYTFREQLFALNHVAPTLPLRTGRFYPKGSAWRGLNCFKEDVTPFRLINVSEGMVVGDTNHPLANYPLTLQAKYIKKLAAKEEHGGGCNDIAEMVTANGPGMQIPYTGVDTDFYSPYPFPRKNEQDDGIFYQTPRLVNHLDDMARSRVRLIYSKCLTPGMKILDLMGSWNSHLPETVHDSVVTGLGLNEDELQANHRLSKRVVHDLNMNPQLPFTDNQFDAVICTGSIEYLTHPLEVMSEVARVVRPEGVSVTTFSDRWFPGKEILPWPDMHSFERLGFVLDVYLKSGVFQNLHTETIRGLPRPPDDPHSWETPVSDPIFAVWASVKG